MTDVGCVRDHNEDSGYADPQGRFFICSDGMGGHAAGDIASRMAVQIIGERLASWPPVFDRCAESADPEAQRGALAIIEGALRAANSSVFERGRVERDKRGMGCTADVVVICGGLALFGHVGDSRVYFIRGPQVQQLTVDHSFAPPPLPGQPPPKGKLTSALGPNPNCKVDTFAVPLQLGDRLLMCTDGLADYFPDPREIAQVLADRGDEHGVPTLINMAKQRGGADNITVVLARYEEDAVQHGIDRSRARTVVGPNSGQMPVHPGVPHIPAQAPQMPAIIPAIGGLATGAQIGGMAVTAKLEPVKVPPEMLSRNKQAELRSTIPIPENQPAPQSVVSGTIERKQSAEDSGRIQSQLATTAPMSSRAGRKTEVGRPVYKEDGQPAAAKKAEADKPVDPPLGARERTLVDRIGIFTQSALFNAVPTTAVTQFLQGCKEIQLMAGAPVPRDVKGSGDTAWFIIDGEHKGELLYPEALIAPQNDWGELDKPLANTNAVPVSRREFTRFCEANPEAGVKMLTNVARLITADLRSKIKKE